MPLQPIVLGGRVRLINVPLDAGARERWVSEEENVRRFEVSRRRMYYGGEQYDKENLERMETLGLDPLVDRLPEHERLHAYSTQIQESIDFIADQMAAEFSWTPEDESVTELLEAALTSSDQFTGDDDEAKVSIENVLREALVAGDTAAWIRWDPTEGVPYVELWESEQVQFTWAERDRTLLEEVVLSEVRWVVNEHGEDRQVTERQVFSLRVNEFGVEECLREVFWDDEEAPREVEWLGLPFIPWSLLRADKKGLRPQRGSSLITDQVMSHADRYNANEQSSYLIARYNSHGNVVIIGDAATVESRESEVVHKDVADVLAFPHGTSVEAITLPTDPKMIEHQRSVLMDAIYGAFGLVRVDQETLVGLSGVSGYALEILNRKTDGTFRRIRRAFLQDLRGLLGMVLDVAAYGGYDDADMEMVTAEGLDGIVVESPAWWLIDPDEVFPNRAVEMRVGGSYIVDDVMIRQDYEAGLVSRREALRKRGYEDDDITQIEQEIEDEKPASSTGEATFQRVVTAGAALNGGANDAPTPGADDLGA